MQRSPLMQTASNLDLCNRFATDEPDFVWFDWGKDYCALVHEPFILIYHTQVFYPPNFAEACDWIADRIREDL